jgi:hypothetical protein
VRVHRLGIPASVDMGLIRIGPSGARHRQASISRKLSRLIRYFDHHEAHSQV